MLFWAHLSYGFLQTEGEGGSNPPDSGYSGFDSALYRKLEAK